MTRPKKETASYDASRSTPPPETEPVYHLRIFGDVSVADIDAHCKPPSTGVDVHAVHRKRAPLPAGSEIEYMGEPATVISDNGGPCLEVECDGCRQTWMWDFEGAECTVVRCAAASES